MTPDDRTIFPHRGVRAIDDSTVVNSRVRQCASVRQKQHPARGARARAQSIRPDRLGNGGQDVGTKIKRWAAYQISAMANLAGDHRPSHPGRGSNPPRFSPALTRAGCHARVGRWVKF